MHYKPLNNDQPGNLKTITYAFWLDGDSGWFCYAKGLPGSCSLNILFCAIPKFVMEVVVVIVNVKLC